MPRDTLIAQRLRDRGLTVIEVAGWQTRGDTAFAPQGSVDHHTAGPRKGNAPSLRICVDGRSDLPGPLCHVLVARDLTCFVIAAGRANHAGRGGWKGLAGNTSVYGVERENVGTSAEPWTPGQTAHAAKVHAALISRFDTPNPALVCRHAEWTTRKIDTHSITGALLRASVADELHPDEPDPAPIDEEIPVFFAKQTGTPEVYLFEGARMTHIKTGDDLKAIATAAGIPSTPATVSAPTWDVLIKGRVRVS